MKITIMGGTGYIGQGILSALAQDRYNYELTSLSRSGAKNHTNLVDPVNYLAVDLTKPGHWQTVIDNSDVVVDCVGIFLPSKRKNTSYQKNSIDPAKTVIDELMAKTTQTRFVFIAANNAPWPLKNYMKAKEEVIDYGVEKLDNRFVAVYPGMVYDKQRILNFIPGVLLHFAIYGLHLNFLKKYRPVKRQKFNQEMLQIIKQQSSALTNKIS